MPLKSYSGAFSQGIFSRSTRYLIPTHDLIKGESMMFRLREKLKYMVLGGLLTLAG